MASYSEMRNVSIFSMDFTCGFVSGAIITSILTAAIFSTCWIRHKTTKTPPVNSLTISRLRHNMRIRHRTSDGHEMFGAYDATLGMIVSGNNTAYSSPSHFAKAHQTERQSSTGRQHTNTNGWTECQVLQDGDWLSINEFRSVA